MDRHADGVLVVLAEEHHRQAQDRGEIHALVKVSLRRGPVAEVRHGDVVFPLQLARPPRSDRVQDLRRDRNLRRCHVHPLGHAASVRMPTALEKRVHRLEPMKHHPGELAIRRKNPVARSQHGEAPYLGRLLAAEWRVGAEPPLALQKLCALVEFPAEDHEGIPLEGSLSRVLGHLADDFARLVHHLIRPWVLRETIDLHVIHPGFTASRVQRGLATIPLWVLMKPWRRILNPFS